MNTKIYTLTMLPIGLLVNWMFLTFSFFFDQSNGIGKEDYHAGKIWNHYLRSRNMCPIFSWMVVKHEWKYRHWKVLITCVVVTLFWPIYMILISVLRILFAFGDPIYSWKQHEASIRKSRLKFESE